MKSNLKSSFARGYSSVLTIYPATAKNREISIQIANERKSPIDVIAADMRKVGEDLMLATDKFVHDATSRSKP